MHHRILATALCLALAAVLLPACASSNPSVAPARAAGSIKAPQMTSRGGLDLRGDADVRIRVLVGADGVPDLRTLQVSGQGAGTHRAAIEQWLLTSAFTPGHQNGVPVAAEFSTRVRTRTTVRRM